MTADVNVTAKVARALFVAQGDFADPEVADRMWRNITARIPETEWHEEARKALSALADPEVLAEIAGVLLTHRHDVTSYDAWSLDGCDCGWEPPDRHSDDAWDRHRAHQAAAVVEWLTGGAQ